MQPELLSKGTLTTIFTLALLVAVSTGLLAVYNAIHAYRNVSKADYPRGTVQYVISTQIKRGAIAGIVVSVAISIFTAQALLATRRGEFALTNDTFAMAFLAAIYVPLVSRTVMTTLEFRDRRLIEQTR